MDEYVILVGSMSNSTSTSYLRKCYCVETQTMCQLATDFGYCSLSACIKKNGSYGERKGGDE